MLKSNDMEVSQNIDLVCYRLNKSFRQYARPRDHLPLLSQPEWG